MNADETRALIAALRKDAGEYAIHVRGDNAGHDLSWDQRNVRAWQAADALEATLTVPDGGVRERIARALCERHGYLWDDTSEDEQAFYLGDADAVMAALPVGGETA